MTNEEELFPTEESVEPQKKKRARTTQKATSDHVYSVSGLDGENLEKPKRKRGRPSKAEKEAMLLARQQEMLIEEEPAELQDSNEVAWNTVTEEEVSPKQEEVAEVHDAESATDDGSDETPKKKKYKKTKEEIIAAA